MLSRNPFWRRSPYADVLTSYIALLRAVNVGGTGKLAMTDLKSLCEAAGFHGVRTYIASGNVVFTSNLSERNVKLEIEKRLSAHAGKPMQVIVRTAAEMSAVAAGNPFPNAPGNRTVAVFLNEAPAADALEGATGRANEQLALGKREIYILYDENMGRSKLKVPAAKNGTARNMNTVTKLAAMAGA
jgi:uncharacterized protein (DUF1697 family)